jgi:hypothetical protein
MAAFEPRLSRHANAASTEMMQFRRDSRGCPLRPAGIMYRSVHRAVAARA